jgi:hypothetical protein
MVPFRRTLTDRRVFCAAFMKDKIMVRSLCLVVALIAASGASLGVARAQSGPPHTAAEERACRGDAHRFCKDVLSDEFQVASCLQEHRQHVSHACRTVLEHH